MKTPEGTKAFFIPEQIRTTTDSSQIDLIRRKYPERTKKQKLQAPKLI
jgi:hypothetical protein